MPPTHLLEKLKISRTKKRPPFNNNVEPRSNAFNCDNNDDDIIQQTHVQQPSVSAPTTPSTYSFSSSSTTMASPRKKMFRTLNLLASRTFHHLSIPRSLQLQIASTPLSPTSINDGTTNNTNNNDSSSNNNNNNNVSPAELPGQHLADPPGQEACFSIPHSINADIGAWTSAGWQLVADTKNGTGLPIKSRKSNQDSFFVFSLNLSSSSSSSSSINPPEQQKNSIAVLLGVFDGHGINGREASQVVRDTVPITFINLLQKLNGTLSSTSTVARTRSHSHPITIPSTANNNSDNNNDTQQGSLTPSPVISSSNLFNNFRLSSCGNIEIKRRSLIVKAFHTAFSDGERALRDERHDIDHAFSGTTGTFIYFDTLTNELYCGSAGDSRAILSLQNKFTKKWNTISLTWDHKPTRNDEKKRIRNAGGRVTRWNKGIGPQRVWLPDEWLPGLAMTRSVGDTVLSKYGVTSVPEITLTKLNDLPNTISNNNSETDVENQFIVIASDGIWEFMSNDEVCQFIVNYYNQGLKAADIAIKLVEEAISKWNKLEQVVDDTTAIIAFLNTSNNRGNALTFSDVGNANRSILENNNSNNSRSASGSISGWRRKSVDTSGKLKNIKLKRFRKQKAWLNGLTGGGNRIDDDCSAENDKDEGKINKHNSYLEIGQPWLVGNNGKIESFSACNEECTREGKGSTKDNAENKSDEVDIEDEDDDEDEDEDLDVETATRTTDESVV